MSKPEDRYCIACGHILSEPDENGLRTCIGQHGKEGCGLVYKGAQAGTDEDEFSNRQLAERAKELLKEIGERLQEFWD